MAWNGCLWCASPEEKRNSLRLDLENACNRLLKDDGYNNLLKSIGYSNSRLMQSKKTDVILAVYRLIQKNQITDLSDNELIAFDSVQEKIDAFIAEEGSTTYKKFSDVQSARRCLFGLNFAAGVMTAACVSLSVLSSVYGWGGGAKEPYTKSRYSLLRLLQYLL